MIVDLLLVVEVSSLSLSLRQQETNTKLSEEAFDSLISILESIDAIVLKEKFLKDN